MNEAHVNSMIFSCGPKINLSSATFINVWFMPIFLLLLLFVAAKFVRNLLVNAVPVYCCS